MSTLIKNLHIKNFKSVRDLSLECDRINIFIGRPNAGKSNILEAISLLGAGYSGEKFMEGFIRYQKLAQLFAEQEYKNQVVVKTEKIEAKLRASKNGENFIFVIRDPTEETHKVPIGAGEVSIPAYQLKQLEIDVNGKILSVSNTKTKVGRYVKKYEFRPIQKYKENGLFLHPPFGDNFYLIVRGHKELREEIEQFMKPNGLKLLLDEETKRVLLFRETEGGFLSFPLYLVPDTFQRYIFHLAAIMSNRDSVLLFEEPESHSYPPYIHQLAQHIVDDEGGNQYFITTHNPYLLTPILQEAKDVALFVTWFENYQTHARRLSEAEVGDILNYGMDVFLNLKHFIPHEPSPDFA